VIEHCSLCRDFAAQMKLDLPKSTRDLLADQWWAHQDRADDVRCWNAYMAVFDPEQVVDLEAE